MVLLLTEDDAVADRISRTLEAEGYGCVHIRDPRRALAREHLLDADLVMLGLDVAGAGDVCRRLREVESLAGVAIFVIANDGASEADVLRAIDQGADDFIALPFSPPVLARKVAATIDRQRRARRRTLRLGPGALVGERYRVVGKIGRGGMGVVFLVCDERDGELKALKVLRVRPNFDFGQRVGDRFAREVEILARLRHPGIIRLHDSSCSASLHYYVMDFLAAGSLADRIDRSGPLAAVEALRLIATVADGLQAAHDHGVVHRDLKSENILFDADGRPVITDFGLALDDRDSRGRLTTRGFSVGSVHYMSPEQIASPDEVDARSDVFALGVLLFEALTGRTPFGELTGAQALIRRLDEDPPSPRARDAAIPQPAEDVCLRALARHRGWRFQSAAELAEQARRAAEAIERTGGREEPVAMPAARHIETTAVSHRPPSSRRLA